MLVDVIVCQQRRLSNVRPCIHYLVLNSFSSDFAAQFSRRPPHRGSRNFLWTTLVTKLRSNVTLTQIGSGDPPKKITEPPIFSHCRKWSRVRYAFADPRCNIQERVWYPERTLTLNVRHCRKTSSKIKGSLQNDASSSFPLHGSDLDLTLMTS